MTTPEILAAVARLRGPYRAGNLEWNQSPDSWDHLNDQLEDIAQHLDVIYITLPTLIPTGQAAVVAALDIYLAVNREPARRAALPWASSKGEWVEQWTVLNDDLDDVYRSLFVDYGGLILIAPECVFPVRLPYRIPIDVKPNAEQWTALNDQLDDVYKHLVRLYQLLRVAAACFTGGGPDD